MGRFVHFGIYIPDHEIIYDCGPFYKEENPKYMQDLYCFSLQLKCAVPELYKQAKSNYHDMLVNSLDFYGKYRNQLTLIQIECGQLDGNFMSSFYTYMFETFSQFESCILDIITYHKKIWKNYFQWIKLL